MLAFVLSGCADEGEKPPSPQLVSAAQRVLLTQDDLPGWQLTPAGDRGVPASERELARCLRCPDPEGSMIRRFWGDTYRQGEQQAVANVTVLRQSSDADEAVAALARPGADRCLIEQLTGSVGAGDGQVKADDVQVKRFDPGVGGARGTGFRLTGRVRSATGVASLTTDVDNLVAGRLELNLAFVAVGDPLEPAVQRRVTLSVGERLVAASRS